MAKEFIVSDTGPILHLHWTDAISWCLPQQAIIVVETVWREIERYDASALTDRRLCRTPDPSGVPPELGTPNLDDGKSAALACALELRKSGSVTVLSDDTAARNVCRKLGLDFTGSIGLILEAHKSGRVEHEVAAATITDLPVKGGLWVNSKLIALAIATLDRQRTSGE